jgi:arylamine N-acetyltransferase
MNREKLTAYLNRMSGDLSLLNLGLSPQLLKELQNIHMLTIPFEDLDIPDQRITLDLEKIFDKVVMSKTL